MRIDRIEVLATDGSVLETYPIEGEIGDAVSVQHYFRLTTPHITFLPYAVL